MLYTKNLQALIKFPVNAGRESYVIPDTTTSIAAYAFDVCTTLKSVTIPESVTKIGNMAFGNCESLTSIEFPKSVETFGANVLLGCNSLEEAVLNIGEGEITASKYKPIAEFITKAVLLEGAKYSNSGFDPLAPYLKEYEVDEANTDYVTVDGVLYTDDMSELLSFPGKKELTSYAVPSGVGKIGANAFNSSSVEEFNIHFNVTELGNNALGTNAKKVYGYAYSAAEKYAEDNGLEFVNVKPSCPHKNTKWINVDPTCTEGGSETQICTDCGRQLYYRPIEAMGHDWTNVNYEWSNDLRTVTASRSCHRNESHFETETVNTYTHIIVPSTPTERGTMEYVAEFENEGFETQTFVAKIDSNAYTSRDGLWTYKFLMNDTIMICSYLYEYPAESPEGLGLEIPSEIDGYTVTQIGPYAFEGMKKYTSFVLPPTVTFIHQHAFDSCTKLKKIDIPEGVAYIDDYAFYNCITLEKVTMPSTVISIGEYAFSKCKALKKATVPEDVTQIKKGTYEGCDSLTNIIYIGAPTVIADSAFKDCKKLNNVRIPASVTSIERYAFSGCSSLEYAYFNSGSGQLTIGYGAFQGCNFEELELPESLTVIESAAFKDCANLYLVRMPKSVKTISSSAFRGCSILSDVFYAGSETEWKAIDISAANTELKNAKIHYNVVGEHVFELVEEKEPTCTEPGYEIYRCPCGYEERYDFEPYGHSWGRPTYEWDGNDFVTATKVCGNDPSHIITETVRTVAETVPATCDEKGYTVYTATFENPEFSEKSKTVYTAEALGHNWDTPVYTWDEEKGTVTATVVCKNDNSHTVTETVKYEVYTKTASCTEGGELSYIAEFENSEFFKKQEKSVYSDALGHDWTDITYVWSEDNKTVTAKRTCFRDPAHIEAETVNVTVSVKAPTCTEKGETVYTAVFNNPNFQKQEKVTYTDALGHEWNEARYLWSEDLSSVTALKICKHDDSHILTETVSTTANVFNATCEDDGATIYSAYFTNPEFKAQQKVVDIPAKGHDFGEPEYTWSADESYVTAIRQCKNNPSHIESEIAEVKVKSESAATCTEKGETVLEATFKNPAFTAQTKSVYTEAKGHSWGEAEYTWSEDYSSVTAKKTCANDASHILTQTVSTSSKVITEPTTENEGLIEYTAVFEGDEFTTVTKQATLPKIIDEDIIFPDVKEGAWYYDSVQYVAKKGYITGYQDGRFGPNDSLKRQDFVVILARIAEADLSEYEGKQSKLSDVSAGAYYAPAVNWAVDNNIIAGYQSGKFGVGDDITREQVATILYRFMGSPEVSDAESTLASFTDNGKVSPFAKDSVAWAVQNNVISGMADGRVAPTEGASRAQIASIIMRMDEQGMFEN